MLLLLLLGMTYQRLKKLLDFWVIVLTKDVQGAIVNFLMGLGTMITLVLIEALGHLEVMNNTEKILQNFKLFISKPHKKKNQNLAVIIPLY